MFIGQDAQTAGFNFICLSLPRTGLEDYRRFCWRLHAADVPFAESPSTVQGTPDNDKYEENKSTWNKEREERKRRLERLVQDHQLS